MPSWNSPNSLLPIPYPLIIQAGGQGLTGKLCQWNLISISYHMSSLLMLLFTVVPIFFFPLYSPSRRTRTDWRTTVESDVNLRSIQRPLRRSASQRPSSTKNIFLKSSNKSKQQNLSPFATQKNDSILICNTVIHQPVQVR